MLKVNHAKNTNRFKKKERVSPCAARILCADHDSATCKLLIVWLGQEGYEVKTASTMSDALRLAGSERFDLYLLDVRFEDGPGVELTAKIRAFDPQMPVIIYSADVREPVRQEALKSGAQAFIPKPSELELVTETIERLIAKAKTSR